jgi:hypothetical protein
MDMAERVLERITPRSALGLTLLTLSVIILILGFFIQDIHVVGVDNEADDESEMLADRSLIPRPDASIRLGPGESYRTGPVAPVDDEPLSPSLKGDSVARADVRGLASSVDPGQSIAVKPSGPYSSSSNPAAQPRVSPGYVALLSRTCDCSWAENTKNPHEGTQFKVGQTLHIAAGLAEIVFGCGATAVVEGPAVLELQSSKSSALRSGKLTAHVPDDLEGFTVQTPVVQVVSLSPLQAKGVAKLTCTADCAWADGNAATKEGASLTPGQAVKLTAGLAEITFTCGAKVILQGPASLEIESAKGATLHNGRMTADVPDDLEGFKIRTSTVEILSLPVETKETTGKEAPKQANKPTPTKL